MVQKIEFIGRGWSFPPYFDKASGTVEMLTDEVDIESSLEILFTTKIGERIMQPTYGCDLHNMVFEAMNLTMKTYLKDMIENAILYFEPRIDLNKIDLDSDMQNEGVLLIKLDYTVRTTNSRYNYVFPFYTNNTIPVMNS
jgi:phage baseplate assembly protein W